MEVIVTLEWEGFEEFTMLLLQGKILKKQDSFRQIGMSKELERQLRSNAQAQLSVALKGSHDICQESMPNNTLMQEEKDLLFLQIKQFIVIVK